MIKESPNPKKSDNFCSNISPSPKNKTDEKQSNKNDVESTFFGSFSEEKNLKKAVSMPIVNKAFRNTAYT